MIINRLGKPSHRFSPALQKSILIEHRSFLLETIQVERVVGLQIHVNICSKETFARHYSKLC